MTGAEFINVIQAYYGQQYTPGQRPIIAAYVLSKPIDFLAELFEAVTASFSGQFKTLPDKAIFRGLEAEVWDTVYQHRAVQATAKAKRISHDEQYANPEEIAAFWRDVQLMAKAKRANA